LTDNHFTVAIHLLTLLAGREDYASSDFLAGSLNIHPVLVRKELALLRAKGLVFSKEGKAGGSRLARPADGILLSEVYAAVRRGSPLGNERHEPNPDCPVGRQINHHLDALYSEAEAALVRQLGQTTLAAFHAQFKPSSIL
jgi:DNA-binding IscR family transcriptional regulator